MGNRIGKYIVGAWFFNYNGGKYDGTLDDRLFPEYYLIKMIRNQSNHSMALFLRNWSRSKKTQYSGGIVTAVRYRKEEILTYPMLLTREPFSVIGEKDFLLKHLAGTMQNNGLKEKIWMNLWIVKAESTVKQENKNTRFGNESKSGVLLYFYN